MGGVLHLPSLCLEGESVIQVAVLQGIKGKTYLAHCSGIGVGLHLGGSLIRQCQVVGHRSGLYR